jgi:hypothetical protein
MPIRPYLQSTNSFSPEMVAVMGEAFKEVCRSLAIGSSEETRREIVARLIITLADADAQADALTICDRAVRILDGAASP